MIIHIKKQHSTNQAPIHFSKWLKDSRLVSLYALFTYVTFVFQNETVGISAGLKDCIQKRGRLLHLHQGLDECKTGEDRVQFLEKLILKKSFSSSCPC
ncbi:hypothetical protein SRHO_G00130190 [Serrasalmus rhombeus]